MANSYIDHQREVQQVFPKAFLAWDNIEWYKRTAFWIDLSVDNRPDLNRLNVMPTIYGRCHAWLLMYKDLVRLGVIQKKNTNF